MFKKLFFVALPVGAILGPMAYFSGPEWVSKLTNSLSPTPAENQAPAEPGAAGREGSSLDVAGVPVEGSEVAYLWEVFRFDVTPAWVIGRWPRVTTGLAHLDLQGYRVPLVTGTADDDLAGALTYYFNAARQVQRITFQGTTGDYRKLVSLLVMHHGFVARPTNTPGVFLYEIPSPKNDSQSHLWIQPAPLLTADQPRNRFELTLVLDRQG